jgi:hypothetical protein
MQDEEFTVLRKDFVTRRAFSGVETGRGLIVFATHAVLFFSQLRVPGIL